MRYAAPWLVLGAVVSIRLAAGCGEATDPDPATGAGTIRVTAATTGQQPDDDGYQVTVDGSTLSGGHLGSNDSLTLTSLAAGKHQLRLEGVTANCQVDGGPWRQVNVSAGQLHTVEFAVACVQRVGSILASSATTGSNLQISDYRLDLDGVAGPPIGLDDTLTFDHLPEGYHLVRLGNVAANCTVTGPNPQTVAVRFGTTAAAAFAVTCAVTPTGRVEITAATSGGGTDPDGYIAILADGSSTAYGFVPVEGTGTGQVDAVPGHYVVSLLGVAGNCGVSAQAGDLTRQVDVVAGTTVAVSFAVACQPVTLTQLAFVRDGQIWRVNADGTGLVQLSNGPGDADPSWSPDGRRIAFTRETGVSTDIYVMDADGANVVQRTSASHAQEPDWSPDGQSIVFSAHMPGNSQEVYLMPAEDDGTAPINLTRQLAWDVQPAWSPDRSRIAFVSDWAAYDFTADVFTITPAGSDRSQLTTGFGFGGSLILYYQPAWSPDGQRLAVVRCRLNYYNSCGATTIVLMNADGSGTTTLVATSGFARPTWSPDGQTIAFAAASGSIEWISADGSVNGVIVADGHSPSWRR